MIIADHAGPVEPAGAVEMARQSGQETKTMSINAMNYRRTWWASYWFSLLCALLLLWGVPQAAHAFQDPTDAEKQDEEKDEQPPDDEEAEPEEEEEVAPPPEEEEDDRPENPNTAEKDEQEKAAEEARTRREEQKRKMREAAARRRAAREKVVEMETGEQPIIEEPEAAPVRRRPRQIPLGTTPPTRPGPPTRTPATTTASTEVQMPEDINIDLPAEERTYSFSIDGEYSDLIEAFSRMSGLGVMGTIPSGHVSLKSTQEMDYKTAFNRIRMLLFKHPENLWLRRTDNVLEIVPVNEMPRGLEIDDYIFPNVQAFNAADLDDNELVLLIYSPEEGSVDDLVEIRDYLPDYVLAAPMQSPDQNAMTIFALVKDVRKFLKLVDLFQSVRDDPRKFKKIAVEHMLPSEAMVKLRELMDLTTSGAPAAPAVNRRGGKVTLQPRSNVGQPIKIFPDDEQGVLVVRALLSEIEEIEEVLTYIDVALDDESGGYVIIELKHVQASEIMDGIRQLLAAEQGAAQATPQVRRPTRRGRRNQPVQPGAVPAMPVQSEEVMVYPDNRMNRLIVLGDEEQVQRVRDIVDLLDVESINKAFRIVELQNADAEEITQQLMAVVPLVYPPSPGETAFNATADVATNSMVVVGGGEEMDFAEGLITKWDQIAATATLHSHKLKFVAPSVLAATLIQLDGGAAVPRNQPAAAVKNRRGQVVRRPQPASQRNVSPDGKFIGDDKTKMIYVMCTDDEWENQYLPLIEQFDQNAAPDLVNAITIPVSKNDPESVVAIVTQVLGGDDFAPRMVPVNEGFLVVDADEGQLEQIRDIVAGIDIDPRDALSIERRVFEIKHADTAQVSEAILSFLGQDSSGQLVVPQVPGQPGRGRVRAPRAAATGTDIAIVDLGDRLMVSAPAEKMPDIAELVAQIDVPGSETEIRTYPVPAGVNVVEMADTLRELHGGGGATPQPRRPRGRAVPVPGGPAGGQEITIIARAAARKILVSAPVDAFEEIENSITLLGAESGTLVKIVYDFIDCEPGNAATLAAQIEPILDAKYQEMVTDGRLPAEAAGGGRGATAAPAMTVQADPRGDRVIVAAPQELVDEAKVLIGHLDRPGDSWERVIRTVMLEKADPQEMAATITNMIASGRGAASRVIPPSGRGGRGGNAVPVPQPSEDDLLNVSVNATPGGSAVVLVGVSRDVDEVEGWIHQLDQTVTGGKKIKVFPLRDADMETVADTLMAVVDAGLAKGGRPGSEGGEGGEDLGFSLDLDITRMGKDLYVKGDYFAKTLLVAASPAKMREVEEVMLTLVGDPEDPNRIGIVGKSEPPVPYETYELEHVDAYDAIYSLEEILDALWVPADDKPSVDYIPFTNILVIKGKPDRFEDVTKLIVKYVDKPDEKGKGDKKELKSIMGSGTSVEIVAQSIRDSLAAQGADVEIIYTNSEVPKIERIHPCLLPPHVFEVPALVVVTSAPALYGPQQVDEPAENASNRKAQDPLSKNLQSLVDAAAPTTQDGDAEDAETSGPKQPSLKIIVDEQSGNIMFVGAGDLVEEATELMEKMIEDLKEATQMPDIRIYRLKYIDPRKAVDILDTVLNDRAAQQRAMALAQQQARAAQRAAQQAARNQRNPGNPEEDEKGGRREGSPDDQQQQQAQVAAQKPQFNVIMYPNSSEKTLIVRAETELFPTIESFLATIDREQTRPMDYKIIKLEKVLAADAEAHLREILGMDGARSSGGGARRQPRGGGTRQGQAVPIDSDQIAIDLGGDGSSSFNPAEDITITAITESNSLIVMAPEEPMKLVERLINDLESQERVEWETIGYEVANADAELVANTLNKVYGGAPKGGGGRNAPEGGTVPDKMVTIVGDSQSGLVFVTAASDMQLEIAERIREFDEKAGLLITPKSIKVTMGRPSMIAEKIEQVFGGKGGRNSKVQVIGDDTTMQLLVTAPEGVMQQIESLVATLDSAPPGVDLKVYSLEYAKASEIVRALDQLVQKLAQQLTAAGIKLDVYSASADDRSNSLVVVGGPITFELVEQALATLDAPPRDPTQIVTSIYQLINANAVDVARNITQVYGGHSKDGVDPPKAEANAGTNTLIVRGTKRQVEDIYNQMIKPLEETQVVVKPTEVYFLQYADPGAVANAVNNMFGTGPTSEAERVQAVVDGAGQSVVVIATAEKQERIEALIKEMDVDATREATVRKTYKIENARASDLANIVNQAVQAGNRNMRSGKPPVSVVANDALNMLVVTASPTDHEDIAPLIAELDRKPDEMLGLSPKVYPLEWADPGSTVNTIANMFPKLPGQGPEDTVRAAFAWGSPSVVVTASPENHERIAALITQIDQQGTAMRDVHVVTVKHADAAAVTQSLRDTFGRPRPGQAEAVTITNPSGSSTLLIKANEKEFADIQAVIAQMDTADSDMTGQVATIALQYTDAQEMITILQEYLRKPGGAGGRSGAELSGDVRLSAVTATNSLVVSGDPEEIEQVKATVAKIDVEVENAAGTPQIIKLTHAIPSDIEPALNDLFAEQRGGTGRGRSGGGSTMTPVIVANDGSQSIIVRASAPDLRQIEGLVAQMDTPDSAGGVSMKIITLPAGMRADEMADRLDDLLDDIADIERDSRRGGRNAPEPPRVLVSADTFSNSLILAGPEAKFPQVETLVQQLRDEGPAGGKVTTTIQIINRDPEEIKRLIEEMVNEAQGGASSGGGRSSGNRGGGNRGGGRGGRR